MIVKANVPPKKRMQKGQDELRHGSGHCLSLSAKNNMIFIKIWPIIHLYTCMTKTQIPTKAEHDLLSHRESRKKSQVCSKSENNTFRATIINFVRRNHNDRVDKNPEHNLNKSLVSYYTHTIKTACLQQQIPGISN